MIRVSKTLMLVLTLVVLAGLTLPVLAADTKGKIASVQADKNEFVLTNADGKNWTFHLNKDGKVFLNDKAAKLADLQAGDMATVTYEKAGENLNASEVRATRKK
jgi:hypothetical protein